MAPTDRGPRPAGDASSSIMTDPFADLWKCPRCGASFVSKNLWHSCGEATVDDWLEKAGPIGRIVRLIVAICLIVIDVPVLLEAGRAYNLRVAGLVLALTAFYVLVHFLVSRYLHHL